MSAEARAYRWTDLETDRPMPLAERRRIVGDHAMLSQLVLHRGFLIPVHTHENEQFAIVLDGLMRFTLPREDGSTTTIDVRGGEVLHVPANVPHGAEAIETTTIIDAFAPPSEGTGVDAAGGKP